MARWMCGAYDWNKVKAFRIFRNMEEQEKETIAEQLEYVDYFDAHEMGWNIFYSYTEDYNNNKEAILKLKGYDNYHNEPQIKETDFGQKYNIYKSCTNNQCYYHKNNENKGNCGYFGNNEILYDCFSDIMYNLVLCIELGGNNAVKELKKQVNEDVLKWASDNYNTKKYGGIIEKQVYGGNKMSKPFWVALSELKVEDELSVFWTENMMYVNDENDGQATTNVSLFQAYKFAILINATYFDYIASDKEIKELSEQLLDLIDEDKKAINIWNYIDDIQKDFFKLTGRWIGLDDKRHIVCYMTEIGEDNYDLMCSFGSASYIAKMLWDYIKGNNKAHIPKCNNKVINNLADRYLKTDEYDILKFAEELHKEAKLNYEIEINGSLWVNSAKYEYVDKIIIDNDDVEIYYKNKEIGCIARENIITLIEQNYEKNIMTDLIENLAHLFDITKVGDF